MNNIFLEINAKYNAKCYKYDYGLYSPTLKTNTHTLTIFKSLNIQRKCMSFDYMSLLGCWGKPKLSPSTMYNIKLLSLNKLRCSFPTHFFLFVYDRHT